MLGYVESEPARFEDAQRWLTLGDALIERIHGQGSLLQAWLLNDWSDLYLRRGDLIAAERAQRQSLALKTALLGSRHPDVAGSLSNLAMILDEMDRLAEAMTLISSALEIVEQYGFATSPMGVNYHLVAAEISAHLGHTDDAQRTLNTVEAIVKSSAGSHAVRAMALTDWADLLLAENRPKDALEAVTQARAIERDLDLRPPVWDAQIQFAWARALIALRLETKPAAQMVSEACFTYERFHDIRGEREILRWYNGRPGHAGQRQASSCSDLPRSRG